MLQKGEKREVRPRPDEKRVEAYLTKRAAGQGWLSLKYTNANQVGYPDRVVLTPGGGCFWVELKSPGQRPREIQELRMAQLRGLGHRAYVAASYGEVDEIIGTELRLAKGEAG